MASVFDSTTKEAFTNIPDNIVFKKSLNIYKYIQPIKSFTDFNMPLSDTQFLSKLTMTFTKEKPYFAKESSIDAPSAGYTQGLCFVAKTITQTSTLDDGLYMDGGLSKTGNSSVGFKGPYDETKKYINSYPYSYYTSESESKAADDKYTYKVDFASENPGIYKIDNGWFYFTTSKSGANMYKIKLDGSRLTPIGNDQAESFMDEYDGHIYYQNYSDGNKLYRIKTDGTQVKAL